MCSVRQFPVSLLFFDATARTLRYAIDMCAVVTVVFLFDGAYTCYSCCPVHARSHVVSLDAKARGRSIDAFLHLILAV